MNNATKAVVIVAVLFVLGLTAWLLAGIFRSPLYADGGRTCVGCVEVHTASTSRVQASSLSGTYRFREPIAFLLRFEDGSVSFRGDALEPGCYVAAGERGDAILFEGANDVLLEAPPPEGGCG